MKITIKKFMELSNIEFETPVKIEAGHDVGKSTIFRAVLFAITGKDVDGKEFDGKIYPKKSESLSDLFCEVEIEHEGIVFNKKASGNEKRDKGSDETILQKKVTSVYSIDYRVVGKAEYDATIKEVFGNFHLFCNPDYFRNLGKEDKRAIFSSLIKINKADYFNGLGDKKTISGKIQAQKEAINNCNVNIAEFSKVQEPEQIKIVDLVSQISELRKQRENATPELSFLQIETNNEINRRIAVIEKSIYVPESLIPFLPEISKPDLINISDLQNQLNNIQLSEPNVYFFDAQILQATNKIKAIKALQLQIENYDENVKNAKCTLCQVCASPDCQFKKIELMSLDELIEKLSDFMSLEDAEKSLLNLENEKIEYLRDFEAKNESEIERLKKEIKEAEKSNDFLILDYEKQKMQIETENKEILNKNNFISSNNALNLANFETEKAKKIAELKSNLHILPDFDYSEIDEKINNLVFLQDEQQNQIDIFNKELGAYIYANKRISELQSDLQNMKKALIEFERELIKIKDAENSFYSDFENLINNEMPENVKISLFKKNLSNDEYSEVFEIEFDGSIYAGNGKTIAFYIWLCSWFQTKFEMSLPIFIDEAIILNESLYSGVKNTVILMRNDNCKTLKITELIWQKELKLAGE